MERYSDKFIQLPQVMSSTRRDKNCSANLEVSYLRKAKLRQEMLEARKQNHFSNVLGAEGLANIEANIRNDQQKFESNIDPEKYLLKLVDDGDEMCPDAMSKKLVTVADFRINYENRRAQRMHEMKQFDEAHFDIQTEVIEEEQPSVDSKTK